MCLVSIYKIFPGYQVRIDVIRGCCKETIEFLHIWHTLHFTSSGDTGTDSQLLGQQESTSCCKIL